MARGEAHLVVRVPGCSERLPNRDPKDQDPAVPTTLKLVDSKSTRAGVAIHSYERAGAMQFGSVEVTEWQETFRRELS